MNEVDKLFADLPSEDKKIADVFGDKKEEPKDPPAEGEAEAEKATEARKNRRERRMEEKYERSQAMNIELNQRILELSESKKFEQEFKPVDTAMPAEWIMLYGNTPESEKAWKVQSQLNQKLFAQAKQEAKDEALKEFKNEQKHAADEQKKFEAVIDTELESLEDEHNVDLTSNAPAARKARREFLELVGELSPKDSEGNLVSYADFGKSFELYQRTKASEKKPDPTIDKGKELAARGMNRGSGSTEKAPEGPMNFETARRAINRMIRN